MSAKREWYAFKNETKNEVEVYLYDEIGFFGVGAKTFIADLQKHSGKHIHLRINSPGGEVIEGTAIYNALKRHAAGVTVHIDAMAASMASVIAMSGQPVMMADNALLMIHDPYTFAAGTSEELRKSADLLDTMKANLTRAYVQKTGLPESEVQDMMAKETWMSATEAVALGFVDYIEEGVAAAASMTKETAQARFDTLARAMAKENAPRAEDEEKKNPEEEKTPEENKPEDETSATEELEKRVEELEETVKELEEEAKASKEKVSDYRNRFAALRKEHSEAYAALEKQYEEQGKLLENLEKSKGLTGASNVPDVKPESNTLSKVAFDGLSAQAKADFFRNGGKLSQ